MQDAGYRGQGKDFRIAIPSIPHPQSRILFLVNDNSHPANSFRPFVSSQIRTVAAADGVLHQSAERPTKVHQRKRQRPQTEIDHVQHDKRVIDAVMYVAIERGRWRRHVGLAEFFQQVACHRYREVRGQI